MESHRKVIQGGGGGGGGGGGEGEGEGEGEEGRTPVNKSNVENIMAHINSYHPVIIHYNRKNRPNRRYLDPELTEKSMWEEYIEKRVNKEEHIAYTTSCSYFIKPGQDDCQECVVYHDHMVSLNLESEEWITPRMKRTIECIVVPRETEPE